MTILEQFVDFLISCCGMRLMGRACSTNGRRGMDIGYWRESQKKRILKWILKRWDGIVWIRSIWPRIGTSGGLL
jgi:hypothetical protein